MPTKPNLRWLLWDATHAIRSELHLKNDTTDRYMHRCRLLDALHQLACQEHQVQSGEQGMDGASTLVTGHDTLHRLHRLYSSTYSIWRVARAAEDRSLLLRYCAKLIRWHFGGRQLGLSGRTGAVLNYLYWEKLDLPFDLQRGHTSVVSKPQRGDVDVTDMLGSVAPDNSSLRSILNLRRLWPFLGTLGRQWKPASCSS